ncbi:NADH-quinone oxidoreductase subunit G [Streptomyces sp. CB01881]|uniref:NADH-quinone oxidoreductase subunit G n=1 Tax=Streptomyces sp. CB01881 TaxID=2078691 RepID=UPI000CDCA9F9|nr:NADH-quinone oxidoreductase subunit G [Streptomyces sp. CB01881]AUY50176.1 NADH-quinone oxidoreductase subunit G [Streptomyces sp. CB01881]TYC73569.1 NADH-quinone oxidoreductase subunit G [Streptomyces sp. CB01881]
MTITEPSTSTGDTGDKPAVELVTLTIDGVEVQVPKGTLVIRAAEQIGTQIPRFCDHPLLDPVGACRQCIVEIEGQRKPVASCTIPVAEGMVVRTQVSSPVAEKAQRGVMELLLINHPLDCPVCDKGGECPLQNQAMSTGDTDSRFEGMKRTYEKPIPLSTQVLLDRERCVLCARCTRFSQQIAGDPFIDLVERGALQQVGTGDAEPLDSYFSGNTIQICPVGALTSAAYRFRSRPFDLVSSPSVCEHCSSGCAQRTDHRRGKVLRRLAGEDPAVNEEWSCDKGRFAFRYAQQRDRFTTPLVRDAGTGELAPASWPEALAKAAEGLRGARAGVLTGGRVTVEDAYAYAKFARVVLGTNDVDFRSRPHSGEEAAFLAAVVAGHGTDLDGDGVTYQELEGAPAVLLAGFEPEEESPIVFLRLRKATRAGGLKVFSIAAYGSRGLTKLRGALLPAAPGTEAEWLAALAADEPLNDDAGRAAELLRTPGAVILAGERLAATPGALTAVLRLSHATGARLAWVPRRAGERGAVEAGALPGLLPGGRPVSAPAARAEAAAAWGVAELPARPGRDTEDILAAAFGGELGALLVGGVDPDDLPDPALAEEALAAVPFVVSLELRPSAVTAHADVVLPVAAVAEKAGTFLDWEGRVRMFEAALKPDQQMGRHLHPDGRVLNMLADALGHRLGLPDVRAARLELDRFAPWAGDRATDPATHPGLLPRPATGQAVLAGWRQLLDNGTLQQGDPHLAGTRHRAVARISPVTAEEVGVTEGPSAALRLTGPAGSLTLPLEITKDIPDRTVWIPLNSTPGGAHRTLGTTVGHLVTIAAATVAATVAADTAADTAAPNAPSTEADPTPEEEL